MVGILGAAKVKHNLVIHVVEGKGQNLMGRDWLSLKLTVNNTHNLSTPSAVQDMVARHAIVFSEKLSTLKGTEIKLHVHPNIQPQFFKARSIPYAFKSKVKQS